METIDTAGALAILRAIAGTMEENKSRLIEMDQAIGDGDLGLTMANGFAGAAKDVAGLAETETEPGRLFLKAGMAINKHAPSTMGTLMATGFMRGGKAVAGKTALDSRDLAVFFQAFLQGLLERGKAKPGDKTVVDAATPAADAAAKAAGQPLAAAIAAIQAGAEEGLEATKTMMSQHGKAAVFREKTIGLIDPGCAAFCLVTKGFATAIDAPKGHTGK